MTAQNLNDRRAQLATLEREIAQETLPVAQAFYALLASDEVAKLLAKISDVAAPLDDATRSRLEQWIKLHGAIVALSKIEVDRMVTTAGLDEDAPAETAIVGED